MSRPDWMGYARCTEVDPDLHFPDKGHSTAQPKRICMACEVRVECLAYAIEHNEEHGVWGGLSYKQRRDVKHGRKAA